MSTPRRGTIVLTGATSGIGRATARRLAPTTGTLVVHGPEPAEEVDGLLWQLRRSSAGEVHYVRADFTSLLEVRAAAGAISELVPRIDALVNNAGVPGSATRSLTADGFERTWQVNHVAPALLTELLLPRLGPGSRIVNVSSTTHRMTTLSLDDPGLEHGYDPVRAYARSKLAVVASSVALAARLRERRIDVLSISPGVISTSLLHAMFGAGGRDVEHGARRLVEALDARVPTGSYIDDGELVDPSAEARDPGVRDRLTRLTAAQLDSDRDPARS
ncbi:SDR family oxidoreductase [Kineococcus sp. NUM-3379]